MKELKRIMLVALAVITLTMTGAAEAQAATKKPGNVKNIEETKVTESSIAFKFKKVKGAEKYQIRLYNAEFGRKKRAYQIQNEKNPTSLWTKGKVKDLVQEYETKKTKFTIKNLKCGIYAIKIRAVKGNQYGKWALQFIHTYYEGAQYPGISTATGKALEKEYDDWKKAVIKEYKENWNIGICDREIKCISNSGYLPTDPNNVTKAELAQIYKRGFGTDVEVYQIIKDLNKDMGIPCEIVKDIRTLGGLIKPIDYKQYVLLDLKNSKALYLSPTSTFICGLERSDYADYQ